MNVIEYCTEEVRRQGHDIADRDGIERVGWMLDAWAFALEAEKRNAKPSIDIIRQIGYMVERHKNRDGFRVGAVHDRRCPPATEVEGLLRTLVKKQYELDPLDFYRQYEMIHPFFDGNGRSGKILLNWKSGTLLNPFFPPDDFWGYPIQNP